MGKRRRWSNADVDRLVAMRDVQKMKWRAIGNAFGRDASTCCWTYGHYKQKRHLEAMVEGQPAGAAKPAPIAPKPAPSIKRPRYFHDADADVMARIARQGLTAGLLGDPPPGRSALDQKHL